MEHDSLDEELEAEVAKLLDPGVERQRQVAVQDLHTGAGLSAAMRVLAVSIVTALVLVVVGVLLGVISVVF